jgi:hypothetical protein
MLLLLLASQKNYWRLGDVPMLQATALARPNVSGHSAVQPMVRTVTWLKSKLGAATALYRLRERLAWTAHRHRLQDDAQTVSVC